MSEAQTRSQRISDAHKLRLYDLLRQEERCFRSWKDASDAAAKELGVPVSYSCIQKAFRTVGAQCRWKIERQQDGDAMSSLESRISVMDQVICQQKDELDQLRQRVAKLESSSVPKEWIPAPSPQPDWPLQRPLPATLTKRTDEESPHRAVMEDAG